MNNKKGFTLIELLVVLVIIAILTAIVSPLYSANTNRAKASEAVGAMALIRQAQRDYRIAATRYYTVIPELVDGNIQNPIPVSVSPAGIPTPSDAGVDVDVAITPYFSNQAYEVIAQAAAGQAQAPFDNPPTPVDFLILVDGNNSVACTGGIITNCASKADDVEDFRLEMDNAGRIFVCYDGADCGDPGNWRSY